MLQEGRNINPTRHQDGALHHVRDPNQHRLEPEFPAQLVFLLNQDFKEPLANHSAPNHDYFSLHDTTVQL